MSDAANTDVTASPDHERNSDDHETTSTVESPGKLVYRKRTEFLDHAVKALDMLIYSHMSYLYLLDCNMFRFIASAIIQLWALTPKPIPPPQPRHHSSLIVGLFFSTTFCLSVHLLSANPSAGDATHGYMHGGLLIDFVGQKGPTSKFRLIFVDLGIFFLQLVMLCLTVIKHDIPAYADIQGAQSSPQDVENEERGMRRQMYNPDGSLREIGDTTAELNPEEERERLAAEMERRSFQITSGEFDIARVNIFSTVKRLWREGRTLGDTQSASSGTTSLPPEELIRRGRAWRFSLTRDW